MEATRKTNNFGARGEKEEDQGRYPRWEVGPASIANRAGCCSARGATRARTCGAYPSLPPPTPTCVHACGLRRCTRAWLRRPLLQLQRPHVSATTPRPACPPPLHLPLRRGRWAVVGLTCQYVFRQKKINFNLFFSWSHNHVAYQCKQTNLKKKK